MLSVQCPGRGSCKATIGRMLLVTTDTYIVVPALHCLAALDAPSHLCSLCQRSPEGAQRPRQLEEPVGNHKMPGSFTEHVLPCSNTRCEL